MRINHGTMIKTIILTASRIGVFFIQIMTLVCLSDIAAHADGFDKEVNTLADEISKQLVKNGSTKEISYATLDFIGPQATTTQLGKLLSEELSVSLSMANPLLIEVERKNLDSVLSELKLSSDGMIDPEGIKRIGQFTGAEILITGEIFPMGQQVRIIVKAVHTETARRMAAAKASIALTPQISSMLNQVIAQQNPRKEETVASATTKDAPESGPDSKNLASIDLKGIRFTPAGCIRTGDEVNCTILFENLGKNPRVITEVRGQSYLYDNLANRYPAIVQISGAETPPPVAQRGMRSGGLRFIGYGLRDQQLMNGVPEKVSFMSNGVDDTASSLTVSCILIDRSGHFENQFPVIIKNLPIQ